MSAQSVTFGQAIAKARKAKGLSQKELAALVKKEEGGGPVSPQYLNDIEHDRRSPTSDHLIKQFATILDEDEGYLFVLAGKIPDDVREKAKDRDKIVKSFANFIKNIFAEDARAALSVLEPRIEALERELAEAVAVERFCRECGASVAVDPSFMACHCRTMIWPIRNGERG